MALRRTLPQLGASSLQMARQRPELTPLDLEEELLRIGVLLAGALVASLTLALALASVAATFVIHFWEGAPLAAALGAIPFFAMAAALMAWRVACALRDKPRFLAGTLAETGNGCRHQWLE